MSSGRDTQKALGQRKRRPARVLPGWLVFLVGFGLVGAVPAQAAGQLELIPSPLMLISLLVLFVVLVFPLNALIFRPIFEALDERHRRTAGARERSEEVSQQADEVLQRYGAEMRAARIEAEKIRKAAMEEAREEQARVLAEARANAEAKVEEGRGRLASSLEDARAELEAHARDLAEAAAQRVMGRAL